MLMKHQLVGYLLLILTRGHLWGLVFTMYGLSWKCFLSRRWKISGSFNMLNKMIMMGMISLEQWFSARVLGHLWGGLPDPLKSATMYKEINWTDTGRPGFIPAWTISHPHCLTSLQEIENCEIEWHLIYKSYGVMPEVQKCWELLT